MYKYLCLDVLINTQVSPKSPIFLVHLNGKQLNTTCKLFQYDICHVGIRRGEQNAKVNAIPPRCSGIEISSLLRQDLYKT